MTGGYCHCDDYLNWLAAPFVSFGLWGTDTVTITSGKTSAASYSKSDRSVRKYCTAYGGHFITAHSGIDLVNVYPSQVPELESTSMLHVG